MILAALSDYYRRLLDDPASGIAAPGYSQERISYAIVLADDGNVVDIVDLRDTEGRKPRSRILSVPQPEKRTVGVKSNFFWDKTSYVLGVSASSKRSAQEHEAFKALHRQALADSNDPGLKALS
ncbi:MAG: type I-C CRISPR-associated protein Cas8c/Csd1, partial [Pigmentiphaga sp.]